MPLAFLGFAFRFDLRHRMETPIEQGGEDLGAAQVETNGILLLFVHIPFKEITALPATTTLAGPPRLSGGEAGVKRT